MNSPDDQGETSETSWIKIVSKYNHPSSIKSWVQFSLNLFLYSIAWFLMFESLSLSYWITLGLSFPAAGMLVRLFIIYHDCVHGSFFKSRKLRDALGLLIGILTFTPYFSWSNNHLIHHETAGNLDKRGIGDVWTMTVTEYQESSKWKKIIYRFYRNPITMFGIGPLYVFLIGNRFKLPRILQYFTGNIGFHHIHHLSPLIPNYYLSRCHRENALFSKIKPLEFWSAFRTVTFRLWDEKTREMISFRKLKFTC
jgi:omega-6 fatty acid desaturase (delta-12 desaturase)